MEGKLISVVPYVVVRFDDFSADSRNWGKIKEQWGVSLLCLVELKQKLLCICCICADQL